MPDPIDDIKKGLPDADIKKKYSLSDDDLFTLRKYDYVTSEGGVSKETALRMYPNVSKYLIQPAPALKTKQYSDALKSGESILTSVPSRKVDPQEVKANAAVEGLLKDQQGKNFTSITGKPDLSAIANPIPKPEEPVDPTAEKNQEEANALYTTPTGRKYYDFVQSVWKPMVNAGKNIIAGGVRATGQIAKISPIGIGATKLAKTAGVNYDYSKTANEVADKIVDYFDFDKRSQEDRPDAFLYATPNKLQGGLINDGKVNTAKLIPSTIEALTTISTFVAGGQALGAGKAGMFASTYLGTVEDYRKAGKDAGLTGGQLDAFATLSAGVTSAIFLGLPAKAITGQVGKTLAVEAAKDIAKGVTVKQAVARGAAAIVKANLHATGTLLGVKAADHAIHAAYDAALDEPIFHDDLSLGKIRDEVAETVLMAVLPTTLMMAPTVMRRYTPDAQVKSSMLYASQNLPEFTAMIDKAQTEGRYTPEQVQTMKDNIGKFSTQVNQLQQNGYSPDQATRMAWAAYKDSKLTNSDRAVQDNPILRETIGKEAEKDREALKSDIKDAAMGIPEMGSELTGEQLSKVVENTPSSPKNLVGKIEGKDYRLEEIDLEQKFKDEPAFRLAVENFEKSKEDPEGLRTPAIVDVEGKVLDGKKRLVQQYVNGEKTARVFKELKQDTTPSVIRPEELSKPDATTIAPTENIAETKRGAAVVLPKPEPLDFADPLVIEADNHVTETLKKGELPVTEPELYQLAEETHNEIINGTETTRPETLTEEQAADSREVPKPESRTAGELPESAVREAGETGVEQEGIDFEQPLTNKEKAKSIADKMRAFADSIEVKANAAYSRPDVIPRAMLASGIRIAAKIIEAGGAIADGIKAAVAHIKASHPEIEEDAIRDHVVDTMVEAGIKESPKTKGLKTKIKSSTSTVIKDKVMESEMSALKRQIKEKYRNLAKGEAEGFKKGRVDGVIRGLVRGFQKGMKEGSDIATKAHKVFEEHVAELKGKINDMLDQAKERGVFNSTTKASMVASIGKVLNSAKSPVALLRAMDHVAKIIDNVEYDKHLNEANTVKKNVAKVIKGKALERAASNVEVVKAFLKINPKDVTDISEYKEIADKVLTTSKAMSARISEGRATVKDTTHEIDNKAIRDYTEKQLDHAEELAKQRIADSYNDLVDIGVIDPATMSLKEMKEIVDAVNDGGETVDEKLDRMKAEGAEKKRAMTDMVEYQQMGLDDHIKNGSPTFTPEEAVIADNLASLDVNDLSVKQLVKLNDVINNIVTNGEFFGSGELAAIKEVQRDNVKIAGEIKASGINLGKFAEGFGSWISKVYQHTASIHLVFDFIAKSSKLASRIQQLSGISEIFTANARATIKQEQTLKQYDDLKKTMGKDIDNAENRLTRGIYARVIQDLGGTPEDVGAEFNRVKGLVKQSYENLLSSELKEEKQEGEIIKKVYDKILATSTDAAQVESKMIVPNKKLVEFWIDKFAQTADKAEASAEIYNNKLFDRYNNYTATKAKSFNGGQINKETADIFEQTYLSKKLDATPSRTKLTRMKAGTLSKGMVYDFDFDSVQSSRFHETNYDIESAPAIAKVKAFFNTPESSKLLGGVKNKNIVAESLRQSVLAQKGKGLAIPPAERFFTAGLNALQVKGARIAIGSLSQLPKQYMSVATSTVVNLGKDMGLYFKAWNVSNKIKLFEQSSIGTRGNTKAGYSRETDVASIGRTNFGNSTRDVMNAISEVNRNAGDKMMKALVVSDVSVARTSWLSYYMKDLQRQGVDINKIDWATEHERFNKEAGIYAEQMTSRSQNPNNNTELGSLYRDVKGFGSVLKNVFIPFSSFSVNQRLRMVNDVQKLIRGGAKAEAMRSLSATLVEQGVFNAIKIYAFGALGTYLAKEALMGLGILDDEDEKEMEKYEDVDIHTAAGDISTTDKTKKWIANTGSDYFFSGMGSGTQQLIQKGLNSIYSHAATETYPKGGDENKAPKLFFNFEKKPGEPDFAQYGMFGVSPQAGYELYKAGGKALSGQIDMVTKGGTEPETKKVNLTDPERAVYAASAIIDALALTGVSDAEITSLNRKVQSMMAKKMKKKYGGESTITISSKGKGNDDESAGSSSTTEQP